MSSPARLDRRHVRRAQTIEQIVDVAVEVMAEHGVAGLSLGEVARRMDMRTPSLYVYFPSKNAVYDAVFARGWRWVRESIEPQGDPVAGSDLRAYAREFAAAFVRWNVEHPVYAQLMSWRPVPDYVPSPEAYEPAVVAFDRGVSVMGQLQSLGLLRDDLPAEELLRVWTVFISGVISQQLSNAPHESFEDGAFTRTLPTFVDMFLTHYAPAPRRGRHADKR